MTTKDYSPEEFKKQIESKEEYLILAKKIEIKANLYQFVGKLEYLTPDIIAYATVHGHDYTDYNVSDNYRKYIAETAFRMVSNITISCPHQLRKTLEEACADKYTIEAAVSMLKEGFVFDETVSCYTNKHETKGVTYHKNITVSIKKD